MIFIVVDIYFRGTALLNFLPANFINYLGTLITILSSNFVPLILISTGAVPEGSDEPDQPEVDENSSFKRAVPWTLVMRRFQKGKSQIICR